MATILGTFPVLNFKKSQTDEYGFDYVSFQYTIKTSELGLYSIKKDDVFTSIESYSSSSPSTGPTFVVDTVETNNTQGGLTELAVNTVGTKNSVDSNTPRVTLLSSGPLIFGLLGTAAPSQFQIQCYGSSNAGQSVEVKFLANGGASGQQQVFATHLNSIMPTTFRGISLPPPARQPHGFNNVRNGPDGSAVGGTSGQYYGFICKTILTERRGSLLLVTLVYSEAGYAFSFNSTNQATSLYEFGRI